MRVFIAGGAGLIGAKVAKLLHHQGCEVLIYDALLNYLSPFDRDGGLSQLAKHPWSIGELLHRRFGEIKDSGRIKFVRGDIRYKGHLYSQISSFRPDVIVDFAAIPLSSESNVFTEDACTVNINGVQNILECIRSISKPIKFVFASSSMVYGDFRYAPCDESHDTVPIDIYGATKLSAEKIIGAYHRQFGIDYSIIRPSAVYGPTDANFRVVQVFINKALSGQKLTLHNPESMLDFTYVDDIAQGFFLAITESKANGNIFNITRGEGRSLNDLVIELTKYFPRLEVTLTERDVGEIRSERGALDISKARNMLGYRPLQSLEEGLALYLRDDFGIEKP